MRPDWAAGLRKKLEKDKVDAAQFSTAFVQESREKILAITTKLQRLLDGYLEQDIERETYRFEKSKLLSEKKSLEEQSTRLEQKRTGWLEPMAEWIKEAESLPKIAQESNLFEKKVAAEKLFGSNLVLANREARLRAPSGEDSSGKNQWAALCAAHDIALKKPSSFSLVPGVGLEPTRLAPHDFKSCVYTIPPPGHSVILSYFTYFSTFFWPSLMLLVVNQMFLHLSTHHLQYRL